MLQIFGSILICLSIFVMAGAEGIENLYLLSGVMALALVGFVLGIVMLRLTTANRL